MLTIESHLRKIRANEIVFKTPYSAFFIGGILLAIAAVNLAGLPKSVGLVVILLSGLFMHLQYKADRLALSNHVHGGHEVEYSEHEENLIKALGCDIATTPLYSFFGISEDPRFTHQNDFTTPAKLEDIEHAKEQLLKIVSKHGFITFQELQQNKRWVRSNQEKGVLLDQSTKSIKGFVKSHCSSQIEIRANGLAWNS
ncbi:hypothetical protein IQ265_06550 [Nodosilinea sp. LEGE 06152]|uniref:hypothetical protein n=1 Tax=Nodosilinea sp. LEGE 06152 TaxID=2777966 RepID=UPI00188202C7|nr:hypothetical protein [Nodosilinea sp. LEGE 06152]MBE9156489.1 hypothetical protein [Nodosilinea sp. LEGE 06152]